MASIYTGYGNSYVCKVKCQQNSGCIGIQFLGQHNHCWLYGGAFPGRVNLFSGPVSDPITQISSVESGAECWALNIGNKYSVVLIIALVPFSALFIYVFKGPWSKIWIYGEVKRSRNKK